VAVDDDQGQAESLSILMTVGESLSPGKGGTDHALLLIFVLAQIFRRGSEMRAELAGTI
jgi:hypothetical protein